MSLCDRVWARLYPNKAKWRTFLAESSNQQRAQINKPNCDMCGSTLQQFHSVGLVTVAVANGAIVDARHSGQQWAVLVIDAANGPCRAGL
eukprot:464364-Prymnesium_polylepis.2